MGDAEYQRALEDLQRKCDKAKVGVATTPDGISIPAIVLTERKLGDFEQYDDCQTIPYWQLAQYEGEVDAIILNIELLKEGKQVFHVSVYLQPSKVLMQFLKGILSSKGAIALSDSEDIEKGGIKVSGVPFDIPLLIVNHVICS